MAVAAYSASTFSLPAKFSSANYLPSMR